MHSGLPREISREQIAELPIHRFEGDVRVVVTPEDLQRAQVDIRQECVVGFDTETKPAFAFRRLCPLSPTPPSSGNFFAKPRFLN